ncbi:MAG: alpha/beta hydrolase [Deltaproteobacteria bacterium]|nr:alpha/beta hydrolase [Deltaproteobacteria bacterium]
MRYLGERLHTAGFTVSGILLAGHRTTVEDLKTKKWQDWYQSVKEGYEELRDSCKNIFVSGISMGALLAFLLAYETKSDITALASLSTGFFFDGWNTHAWQRWLLPLMIYTPLKYFLDFPEDEPYSVKNASVRYDHLGYPVFPAVSLSELYKLMRTVKKILPDIKVPTLIIHSREDDSHSLRSPDLLEKQLGSTVKEKLILDNSYHVVTVDYQKEKVADEVIRFFRRFIENAKEGPCDDWEKNSSRKNSEGWSQDHHCRR